MKRALLLVFSSPADSTDDAEFGRWYDERHIPQVIQHVSGVVSGARYAIPPEQVHLAPNSSRFVAAYQIESESIAGEMAELGAASHDGRVELSDVIRQDPPPVLMLCTEPDDDGQ